MTRNQQRASKRITQHRTQHTQPIPSMRLFQPMPISTGNTPKSRKPRRTQPGVMGTSPYWHNMITIDRRWDK